MAAHDARVAAEEAEALRAEVLEVDGEADGGAHVVLVDAIEIDVAAPLDVGFYGDAGRGRDPQAEVRIDVAAALAEAGADAELD
ncbi:MAG TPA: hypothetical protein VLU41_12185, partial [Ideonella sp.]|nr:hypothetical protein [Ideonella sp.]